MLQQIAASRPPKSPIPELPICHVCSLGSLCQSSQLLQDTGLKRESYPFDWIFSNPTTIQCILDDDFGLFLHREKLIGISAGRCSHSVYGESMFNHHNPKDNDEHYRYFTRCIGRFRALLGREASKLFVMTFPNLERGDITDIQTQVARLNVYLSSKTCNYQIFVILHVHRCDAFDATIVDAGNIRFVTLSTTSVSDGIKLSDPHENHMLHRILLDSYTFAVETLEG